MSAIKHKLDNCIDCDPKQEKQAVIAKRCISAPFYHYQKHNAKRHQENSAKNKAAKASRGISYSGDKSYTIGKWFNDQIAMLPNECENCSVPLHKFNSLGPRCYIAHIVPKRYFESVMLHPLNRVFLCIDCHSKFDNSLSREVVLMKVYPLAVSRFEHFKRFIFKDEIKHLAPCFYDIL